MKANKIFSTKNLVAGSIEPTTFFLLRDEDLGTKD